MATRHFLRDTQTEAGTGGSVYDLATTQGTPGTLGSGNTQSGTFIEVLRFQRTVDDAVSSTSVPVSLDMASVSHSTLEWRFRVQRIDSSDVVQASSTYSSAFNTSGVKTATLTLDTTWATGDRLAIALELRKTGGGGNRSFSLNVNAAASYVDPTLAAQSFTLTADAGAQTWTGTAAGLTAVRTVTAAGTSYAASGTAAGLTAARTVGAAGGSLAWTGTAATLTGPATGYTLAAEGGSLAWTGTAAGVRRAAVLPADSGAWAQSGAATTLTATRRLAAAGDALTWSGTAAGLRRAARLAANAGAWTQTGTAAGVVANRRLAPAGGAIAWTGTAATLTGPGAAYTLAGDAGAVLWTGTAASFSTGGGGMATLTLLHGGGAQTQVSCAGQMGARAYVVAGDWVVVYEITDRALGHYRAVSYEPRPKQTAASPAVRLEG